jgi:hypothetical protein
MRKIALFWMLAFLGVSSGYAATDQDTINFLNKLDSHYYCLMREGLQDFQAGIKCSFFDDYLKQCSVKYGPDDKRVQELEKIQFVLSYPGKDQLSFEATSVEPSGDQAFDEIVEKMIGVVKGAFQQNIYPWRSNVLEPVFGADDFTKFDLQVRKKSDGFIIFATGDQPVSEYADNQWRIYDIEAGGKAAIQSCKLKYVDGPKGMILSETTSEMPQVSTELNAKMEYQSVDGLMMPKRMLVHMKKSGTADTTNLDVVFEFVDYRIDKSPAETKPTDQTETGF